MDPEDEYGKRLGLSLTALRLALGFSRQEDFGFFIERSKRTVQRWESGATQPNAWWITHIAEKARVDPALLLEAPPTWEGAGLLEIGSAAAATVRRETLKRQQKRRGRRGGRRPDASQQ